MYDVLYGGRRYTMEAAAITWQKMRTSATTTAVTRVNIHISITIEGVTHREKQLK